MLNWIYLSCALVLIRMKTMKIALSLIFVYLLVNCVNLINQEMRLQHYGAQLDKDMQQALAQKNKLKQDLQHFSTPQGVEQLARERLGYYKKGEIPLRVIETPSSTEGQVNESSANGASLSDATTVEMTGPDQPL